MLIIDFLVSKLMIFVSSRVCIYGIYLVGNILVGCLGQFIRNKYKIYGFVGNGFLENVIEVLLLFEYKMEMFYN